MDEACGVERGGVRCGFGSVPGVGRHTKGDDHRFAAGVGKYIRVCRTNEKDRALGNGNWFDTLTGHTLSKL